MATQVTPAIQPKVNGKAAQPSYAELMARVKELEAAQAAKSTISVKIQTQKKDDKGNFMVDEQGNPVPGSGAISVYGLQRFPITLFAEQWERFLAGVQAPAGSPVAQVLAACKRPEATRKGN